MNASFRTEVLGQLESLNSEISKPHSFDFYIYLPDERGAQQVAAQLKKVSYSVAVSASAAGPGWLCKATTTLVPETASLDEIHNFMQALAAEYHGEFDGWESDVVKRASSK